jgi:uncharacterized protein (TIGR03032 family)
MVLLEQRLPEQPHDNEIGWSATQSTRSAVASSQRPHDDVPNEAPGRAPARGPAPLRSLHTTNFPVILNQLGISLLVTTYQAGKLVIVRPDFENPAVLNTHFRGFNKPMGLAFNNDRLAVGTAQEIVVFRNVPAVSARLEPAGKHDACFLPRSLHVTGDIQIHEMVYQEDELWFINTRFSCLCTYEQDHNFVPRWWPRFVTGLAPEDRCHLNGIALVDGKPRWVTALGETDAAGGWRENKKDGGILIDLDSGEIVARKLSMPHSPRWYAGRLWLAESGTGSLGFVDPKSGRYESIVEVPGFTRGLDFAGNLAFVGLSQVRETAVFSGIPITERLAETERTCGIWAIDIQSGKAVAYIKFEEAVQEIFAVSVLPNIRFPDIINDDPNITGSTFDLPEYALKDVPDHLKSGGDAG